MEAVKEKSSWDMEKLHCRVGSKIFPGHILDCSWCRRERVETSGSKSRPTWWCVTAVAAGLAASQVMGDLPPGTWDAWLGHVVRAGLEATTIGDDPVQIPDIDGKRSAEPRKAVAWAG